jgi:hypothetical protein
MSRRSGEYAKKLRRGKNKLQGPENVRYQRPKGSADWTPPGYNYMGPGNVVDNAPAQNFADEYARQHDQAYGEFEWQTGRNPKYEYVVGADDVFEEQMSNTREGFYQELAYQAFRAKRKAAEIGLIPTSRVHKMSKKRSFLNMDQGTHIIFKYAI